MSSGQVYKILSIHWGFSLGGVAKYAELLEQVGKYQNLHIKTVCVHGQDWSLDSQTLAGLDAELISIKSRFDFSWVKQLTAVIKQENPDAIITHGFNGHIVYGVLALLTRAKCLWLASYHGEYHGNSAVRLLAGHVFNGLTVWLFKHRVDYIISVAEYSKQHLLAKGVNANKVRVIHNGIAPLAVNPQAGNTLRAEWGIKPDEVTFGVVSRLDPVKGIANLIHAFAEVRTVFPFLKFIVIGTGSISEQLQALVVEKGLAEVTQFVGYRSDVGACLAALDIFVLPSLAEYHSIALLEAMCAEKTIVATDVGGNVESVTDGVHAIVVPPADAAALAAALQQLLQDTPLRMQLASNARQRFVHEFTSDLMIEQTAMYLHGCIDSQGQH